MTKPAQYTNGVSCSTTVLWSREFLPTSASVCLVAEPLADSAGDGINVLERTSQLNSDRVSIDAEHDRQMVSDSDRMNKEITVCLLAAEVWLVEEGGDSLSVHLRGRRHRDLRGLTLDDLFGEGRTRLQARGTSQLATMMAERFS